MLLDAPAQAETDSVLHVTPQIWQPAFPGGDSLFMSLYRFREFVFDSEARLIQGPQGQGELRNQVRQLFELLLEHAPEVVSQETIIAHVWPEHHVKETAVSQLVLELRQALEAAGCERGAVATVPRKGYRWTLEFEKGAAPQAANAKSKLLPALALVLALVLALLFWPKAKPEPPQGVYSIAILPFSNATGNQELAWFELGFPDVIGQILDEDPNLNIIPLANVLRQVEALGLDLQVAESRQRLLRALGAELLIKTSISAADENYALDFSFVQSERPADRWRIAVSRPWDVVPAIAEGLRKRIDLNLVLPNDNESMALDAFSSQAYANGVHLHNRQLFAEAGPFFEVVLSRHPEHNRAKLYLAQTALKQGDYATCQSLGEALLEATIAPMLRQEAQHLMAELHFAKRDYAQAKAVAEPLAADVDARENPDWAIKVYWLLGSIGISSGAREEALTWYGKALTVARENQMLAEEAASLWYQSTVFPYRESNLPGLRQALDLATSLGNKLQRAKLLNAIALILDAQGEYAEARDLFETALQVRRELQDQRGIALGLLYLGSSESRFDVIKARAYFQQCLQIFIELGDAWNQINTYIYMSQLERIEKRYDAAIEHLEKAMEVAREANDTDAFFYIRFNMVDTEMRRGDLEKARAYIAEIRAEANLPNYKASSAQALEALCEYLEGDFTAALDKMTAARALAGSQWSQASERYHQILVQAQAKQAHIPLPIEKDPAKWLLN